MWRAAKRVVQCATQVSSQYTQTRSAKPDATHSAGLGNEAPRKRVGCCGRGATQDDAVNEAPRKRLGCSGRGAVQDETVKEAPRKRLV